MKEAKSAGGLEVFQHEILERCKPIIGKAQANDWQGRVHFDKLEAAHMDVFQHFSEIDSCLERLDEISKLIRHSPPKQWGITKTAFLQFSFETHLQELYVLRERLVKFVEWLRKRIGQNPEAEAQLRRMKDGVLSSFRSRAEQRSQHIHHFRFSNESLSEAKGLELVSSHPDGDDSPMSAMWKLAAEVKYKSARRDLGEESKLDLVAVRDLLDRYFSALYDYVFGVLLRSPE